MGRNSFYILSFGFTFSTLNFKFSSCLSSALYICREPSTNQLLFMQNKPNLLDAQMNVSIFSTKVYENKSNWTLSENKPNSNPIKPNFRKAQMNVNSLITKGYRKKDDFAVRKNKPNSKPISVKPKMDATVFVTKDYENETAFRLQKNKPKSKPISSKAKMNKKITCRKIRPHPKKLRVGIKLDFSNNDIRMPGRKSKISN